MGHERSNTIQDPSGRWINVYGQHPDDEYPDGVSMGLTIPLEPGVSYPDAEQAVAAAKIRSQMHVPHDEMTLREMLTAPRESTADVWRLSQLIPEGAQSYFGSPIAPTWRGGLGGARPIPNYDSPHPRAWDRDREAPPTHDRYGRRR